jgi:Flp pilus assembly protein TadB
MSIPRRLVDPRWAAAPNPSSQHLLRWRRFDQTLRSHARDLGVDLTWSPLVLVIVTCMTFAVLGTLLAGVVGAVGASCLFLFALLLGRRFGSRRAVRRAQTMFPEICVRLSRTIRSGRSVEEAFDEVVAHVTPLPVGVVRVATQSSTGRPIGVAIDDWVRGAESSAERLMSSALYLGVRRGGELATTLDVVGGGLRDDLELDARRRVLLVQATMSAAVLVMLPVVFAVVASVLRGGLVFQGRLGVVLIGIGIGLDGLGFLWMRSLMRGLR